MVFLYNFALSPEWGCIIFGILACLASWKYLLKRSRAVIKFKKTEETIPDTQLKKNNPVSVNFHFTRQCNYECGFCFHTAKTSHVTPLDKAKVGLKKLKDAGMKKLNFSGGEPFLEEKYLGELCKYSKEVLELESVSIVSNGSKIKEGFFKKYGAYVDILAISVDSFDEPTNVKIGRGKGNHLKHFINISSWCVVYNVKLKINSVINRYNHLENFVANISGLEPARWKCFQVLKVDTENTGTGRSIRDCNKFLITDEEFENFCDRHKHMSCFVPESNRMMKSSYLILDEYMRFLSKGDVYRESKSILDISVEEALKDTDWEPDIFLQRGGIYDWTKNTDNSCAGGCPPELQW